MSFPLKEMIEAMAQQAQMITIYVKELQKEGMSRTEALQVAIAYQDSQIKAAALAQVERETKFMNLTPFGSAQ